MSCLETCARDSTPRDSPKKMPPLAVYVHYPFCLRKCRYCAFASIACKRRPDLTGLYLKELDFYEGILRGREIASIYFGGGTPSLMPPATIGAILARLSPARGAEITLEANPATIDGPRMKELKRLGINRLSIGVQSLDDAELAYLGRLHTARDAQAAIDSAREVFENVNADFIYALPRQTFKEWEAAARKIAALSLPHLSLYQLSLERGTALARETPIKESLSARMFALANGLFRQYEVSNYAKRGFECRHSLNYWRGGEYVGIGPSAAGRLYIDGVHYETKNPPLAAWRAEPRLTRLSLRARGREMLVSGLRMNVGIDFAAFECASALDFWQVADRSKAESLGRYLTITKKGIRAAARGRPILDSLILAIAK